MAFWWVNHKQTFKSEIEGGYIWSPKQNKNGAKNQTYLNLTLTRPGDIVFSYAGGIKAIGIVSERFRELPKPAEFGKSGDSWANVGWAVSIDWELLSSPVQPRDHIEEIAPLLPERHSPLQANGNGNQGCYLAAIQDSLGELLLNIIRMHDLEAISSLEDDLKDVEELEVVNRIEQENIELTEKEQIIKARKGQGKFRQNLEKIEKKCRVTGVKKKNFLIASHIKPWRVGDNYERLDGNNGLLLSPHIDKLFDKGWISFLTNGDLVYASDSIMEVLKAWGVDPKKNVGGFNPSQEKYLEFHRNNIFKG